MESARTRSFLLHSAGAFVSQASGVLSVTVFASIGGLSLLGEIGLTTAAGIFLSSVFIASLALATNILVAREHNKSEKLAGDVSRNLLLLGWAASLVAGVIAFVISIAWDSEGDLGLAMSCAAFCTFTAINSVQISVVRGFGDFKAASALAVLDGWTKFSMLIPFLWGSHQPSHFIWAMVVGQLASNFLYRRRIARMTACADAGFREFRDRHMDELSKFVISNIPSNLLVAAFNWICVWTLGAFAGSAEAGKWSIGQRLINVITFLPQRFADVNLTHLSRNGKGTHAEAWRRGLKAAVLCIAFAIPMVVAGSIFHERFGKLSDALDPASLSPFALVAAAMLLVRFRVQHDFSTLCTANETRSALVRMAVLFVAILAMATLGVISSDLLAYVRALSYAVAAIAIFLTEE